MLCIPYFRNAPRRNRPSWREERALNSETFGAPSVAAARRFHHGRHGRGGWRGGGFRRGGGGGGGQGNYPLHQLRTVHSKQNGQTGILDFMIFSIFRF